MGLDALGIPPDFVSNDDATPSGSPTNNAEPYALEPQNLSILDTDGWSVSSPGTSIVGVRSFNSGSFDDQKFEPEFSLLPPISNAFTWSAQEQELLCATYCGPPVDEASTTELPNFESYPYPSVPRSDDNCVINPLSYAIEGAGSRALTNYTHLAPSCDLHDAFRFMEGPWHALRGGSPDQMPRGTHSAFGNRGSTKQIHQPKQHWQCSLCQKYFKRRDNIKPHVRVKHPDEYGSLYPSPTSAPKPSGHPLVAQHPSALDETSAAPDGEYDEVSTAMSLLAPDFTDKTPEVTQSGDWCPTGGMTPQKRSHVVYPTDVVALDGLETRSATRVKTQACSQGDPLACPFQKRYPFKYERCFGVSLHRIKDVKQHIYRSHSSPEYYCAACYTVFDTATDRDNHSRLRECERLDHPFWQQFEGITEDQKRQLSEKSSRTLNEGGQWYQIWDLIFPSQERPKSVYRGSLLGEIVPILRREWEIQGPKIMGDMKMMDIERLNCTMDKFFGYLEGETNKYRHQIGDRCEVDGGGWEPSKFNF